MQTTFQIPLVSFSDCSNYKKFIFYNLLGAVLWIVTLVMAGYWLGNIFPTLIDNVELIIVGLIIVTAIPVIISYRKRNTPVFEKEK